MEYYFKKKEIIRLILLALLCTLIYLPFVHGNNIGGPDAYVYHGLTADALEQYRNHIFPIYVGQNINNFTGTPLGRAPYFLMLVGLLNVLTFFKLSSLAIQHLSVLVSAIAGTYVMYFVLLKIAPRLRWPAFIFAIFYISCPGIFSIIAKLDMYFSFMAVPYLPILIYALIRSYQKNDFLSYVLFAASLSMIWMAHPPIAFWCSVVCAIFFGLRFVTKPNIIKGLIPCALLFILLNLWHFILVFNLKMQQYVNSKNISIDYIINLNKSFIPGAFLPLNLQVNNYSYVQLGYALWIALLLGVMVAIKPGQQLLRNLLICTAFSLIFVLPIPYLNDHLWHYVPTSILGLTQAWPMLRFYPIIATLSCFIGFIALATIYPSQNKIIRRSIFTLLTITFGWSLVQTIPFIQFLKQSNQHEASWLLLENARHRLEYDSGNNHEVLEENIYEPAFHNRLIDTNGADIPGYNNKKFITAACFANSNAHKNDLISDLKILTPMQFTPQKEAYYSPLMKLKILPGTKYLLCFDLLFSKVGLNFIQLAGYHHWTISTFNSKPDSGPEETVLIPVFTDENKPKDIDITLYQSAMTNPDGFIKLKAFNIMSYDISQLPIKLHSLIPYHVTVHNPTNHAYLETAREYVSGYIANVNGKQQPVLSSPTGRVMIPLLPGDNDIKLFYEGTLFIKLSFYISLISWIVVLLYLCRLSM